MSDNDPIAPFRDYLDFTILVGPGQGRTYPVSATSTAGEASAEIHFPFDELALENRLQALQIALLRSGGTRRRIPSPEEQTVQEFGSTLFNTLFAGDVRSQYEITRREATRQGKGVRVKLRIQPPELAVLPWEFLYNPSRGDYMVLSLNTPLVRYIDVAQPVRPLSVTPPLRILGVVANPSGLPTLDVDRERTRLERAVSGLVAAGRMQLEWLEGETWRDLQRAMRGGPWHIIHFIGHGGYDTTTQEGLMVLADDQGQPHALTASQLGRLLADHASLRLVLLNACEGAVGSSSDIFASTAATLVRRGIPAVLAMQYEITDRAAIEFSQSFYDALAAGLPVDAAVSEARKAISLSVANSVEWGTPVLYMRSPTGQLFDVAALVPAPIPASIPPPVIPPTPAETIPAPASAPPVSSRPSIPVLVGMAAIVVLLLVVVWSFSSGVFRLGGDDPAAAITDPNGFVTPLPLTDTGKGSGEPFNPAQQSLDPSQSGLSDIPLPVPGAIAADAPTLEDVLAQPIRNGAVDAPNFDAISPGSTAITAQTAADLAAVGQWGRGRLLAMDLNADGSRVAVGTPFGFQVMEAISFGQISAVATDDPVYAIAISPDGQKVVTFSNDRVVLWDADSGQQLDVLAENADNLDELAFSPDGTFVAGNDANTVILWPVDGSRATELNGHIGSVEAITFAPDGNLLASGSTDGEIRVWNVADGLLFATLTGHTDAIHDLTISSQNIVASSSGWGDGQPVRLWTVFGNELGPPGVDVGGDMDLAFSPDGNTLLLAEQGKLIHRWDMANSKLIRTLEEGTEWIQAMLFAPNSPLPNTRVWTGGEESVLRLWDLEAGEILSEAQPMTPEFVGLAFNRSGQNLLYATEGDLVVRSLSGALVQHWAEDGGIIDELAFGGDGTIASITDWNWSRLRRVGEDVIPEPRDLQDVSAVAISPDGSLAVYGNSAGQIHLVDTATAKAGQGLTGHETEIIKLAYSADGNWLASVDATGEVVMWQMAGNQVATVTTLTSTQGLGFPLALAISADGSRVAVSIEDDELIHLMDTQNDTRLQEISRSDANISLAFSPDGSVLAVGGHSGVELLRVADGAKLSYVQAHHIGVSGVAFSPDGTVLASAGRDGSLHFYAVVR